MGIGCGDGIDVGCTWIARLQSPYPRPWELGGGSLINKLGVGVVCESGVPPSEVVGEVVVEHSGADLQQ